MPPKFSHQIVCTVTQDTLSTFYPLLQRGFQLHVKTGVAVQSLLCEQFSITPEYVSGHIQTIFLNGQPVDDLNTARIQSGDVLALSAAMPGLVGATFRSGGPLAVFRSSITHSGDAPENALKEDGTITLKLFNLLTPELGPRFLEKGIYIESETMKDFFTSADEHFRKGLTSFRKDGEAMSSASFEQILKEQKEPSSHEKILLTVRVS